MPFRYFFFAGLAGALGRGTLAAALDLLGAPSTSASRLNGKPNASSSALPCSLVDGGGDDGDVHAARGVDLVVVDLGEHDLLVEPERVVAAAVPATCAGRPRKSRMRGMATPISRSRNSHMRSPRSVTLQPIDWPSRSLKPAIDLRALVMIGFWPADAGEVGDGALEQRRLLGGPADAHVDDDLLERRHLHHVARAELALAARP